MKMKIGEERGKDFLTVSMKGIRRHMRAVCVCPSDPCSHVSNAAFTLALKHV